jgi:hypothetical protein
MRRERAREEEEMHERVRDRRGKYLRSLRAERMQRRSTASSSAVEERVSTAPPLNWICTCEAARNIAEYPLEVGSRLNPIDRSCPAPPSPSQSEGGCACDEFIHRDLAALGFVTSSSPDDGGGSVQEGQGRTVCCCWPQ